MDLSIYQRPEIELVDSKMCLGFGKALNYLWTVFIIYKCCRLRCNTQEQTLLERFSALTERCCNETLLQNRDKASNCEYLA